MKNKLKYVVFGIVLIVLLGLAFKDRVLRIFFAPTESNIPLGQELGGDEDVKDIVVIAENLSVPWDIVFLADGVILVTERTGALVQIYENGRISRIEIPEVEEKGEGGLLGLALDPNFAKNRFIYLYQTFDTPEGTRNRVVRYEYEKDRVQNPSVLINNIPGASYHDGGRIRFGPDGFLYITTGDAGDSSNSQDRDSLAGKILRITKDGEIPAGNPFGTAIYSWGHRNPQGLTWDDGSRLWSTEHGRSGLRSGLDELNLIEKGKNYGWPVIEGDQSREGMISPVIHSGPDDTWAPASALYYNGSIFWGGLRGQALYEAKINGKEATGLKRHFFKDYGRIRSVVLGPDNFFYITTSNTDGRGETQTGDDKIIRINPKILDI